MKLAQMKRNTQRQVSHQKAVQSRLRLREARLAKNAISQAEREKRMAINEVTKIQNNKHLLEVELNKRATNSRKKANEAAKARQELAKEKLHTGEMNVRTANLRRRLRIRVASLNNAVRNRDKLKKELNEMKAGGDPAKIKEIQRKISAVDGKIKAQEKIKAAAQKSIATTANTIRKDAQRNVDSLEKKIKTKELSRLSREKAGFNFPDQALLNKLIKERDGDPTATNERTRMGALKILNKIKGLTNDRGLLNNANVGSPEFRKKKDAEIANAESSIKSLQDERKELEKELAAVKTAFSNQFSNGNRKNLQNRINAANNKIKELEEEIKKKPVTVVQNAELIAKKIELSRKAAEAGLNFKKNINALTMNNVKANGAPKVLALENKIKVAANAKAQAEKARLNQIEKERREEMNKIRREKENAITAAAAEKATAVKEAEEAAKAKAMANTAEEMAAAQAKLNAAQAKINAAEANKTQALTKAKEERNEALAKAANNKAKALLEANTAAKANKKAALLAVYKGKRNALAKAKANKANALAKAKLEQEQAVKNAKIAQRRLNEAESASEKAKAQANLNQARQDLKNAANNKAKALLEANTAAKANKKAALLAVYKGKRNAIAAEKAKASAKRRRAFETLLNNYNVSMNQRMILTKRFEKGNRIGTIAAELKAKKNANNKAKLNEITEEKNKAVATAAANRNKAKTEANAARKALAAGRFQSAAKKAALEKKLKNAEENIKRAATEKAEALMKAANEKNELQRKAEENKQAAMKGAVVANRMKIALQKKRNAQNELRKLASNKEVNFTRNINRVTLNGVENLRKRIITAGKAKANANAARTLAQFKANRKKAKENANRLAREKAEKAKQEKIANAKAKGEAIRAARAKANKNRKNQNARNAEANKAATAQRIALEKKQAAAKTKDLENLFSKYNAIMANNLGWPIRKDLVREQYRKGKSLENIKGELNVMVNFHRKKAVRGLVSGAIERVKNAEGKALSNARNAFKMKVNKAHNEGLIDENEKKIRTRQANTAMNMSTIQGVDKMFKNHLEKLKRNKAATKIQATFKGAQTRSSVGKEILKKHISGVNVMAGQKIPGFSGKRVEYGDYERDWKKRVDEEGDTTEKRAKLKKMFDDKFELKKKLLMNEGSNVRREYTLGGLQALKKEVMRPRIDQTQSTKGTNQNAAILNVARIKKKIEEARSRYNARRIKASLNKMTTIINNPTFSNNKMPKNTKSSAAFNMTLKRAKPSLRNITKNKIIRPARMASQMKPAQGPSAMELGVQAAAAKKKLDKPMTNAERRVAARNAAGAAGRLGGRMAQQRNNTFRKTGMTEAAIAKANARRADKAAKKAAKKAR